MKYVREIMENSPGTAPVDRDLIEACIEACFECEQACTACADACIGEKDQAPLVACIRLDLACAEICSTTGKIASRELAGDPGMAPVILEACRKACAICAEECENHAENMEHCRVCAQACRACESACGELLDALTS